MDVKKKPSNEKRLIDANKLIKEANADGAYGYVDVKQIADAPTVDAVPVIRCRECKHRYTENCPMYFHDSYWHDGYFDYIDYDTDNTEDDYFCPKGEREEVLTDGLL